MCVVTASSSTDLFAVGASKIEQKVVNIKVIIVSHSTVIVAVIIKIGLHSPPFWRVLRALCLQTNLCGFIAPESGFQNRILNRNS